MLDIGFRRAIINFLSVNLERTSTHQVSFIQFEISRRISNDKPIIAGVLFVINAHEAIDAQAQDAMLLQDVD